METTVLEQQLKKHYQNRKKGVPAEIEAQVVTLHFLAQPKGGQQPIKNQ